MDYEQPISSYLQGLPEPTINEKKSVANLKLLFYWEKHVLPQTREYLKSSFQKYAMILGFEQIRHYLRQGNPQRALEEVMFMGNNRLHPGVNLPSENTDWTAKVVEECIIDSWALAKLTFSKSASQANQNDFHPAKHAQA